MKDRLIALGGALFALYVVILILVPGSPVDDSGQSVPTSIDDGNYGLLGLYKWLENAGIPVYRLRRRYSYLGENEQIPPNGNMMIMVLPQSTPAQENELDQLEEWVRAGNNLLVLVEKSDASVMRLRRYSDSNKVLRRFGFSLDALLQEEEEDQSEEGKPAEGSPADRNNQDRRREVSLREVDKVITVQLLPGASFPLLKGVKTVSVDSSLYFDAQWQLEPEAIYRSSLSLLKEQESGETALWEIRHADSRVWISRYAHMFGNAQLGRSGNARLAANMVMSSLTGKGVVIFDDMHQGYSELYDPKAFFGDSRLHNTIWFILAFWLFYVVGYSNRLAPPIREIERHRAIDYIHAVANLFARRLGSDATAKLLFSHFFDAIRMQYSLPTNGKPVWDILETRARVEKKDVGRLKICYEQLGSKNKQDLTKLTNLMQKIRSKLV
ncbi:MAG: DUF4350 domain-containing protein [Gammaproteobacteria bacterium]|nr:DUF4350 domain-containing protein [Gammaproteobacteria bacterium]